MTSRPAPPTPAGFGTTLEHRLRRLGLDAASAAWVCARVDASLPAMLRRFGLDREGLRGRSPRELAAVEVRCAACHEIARCHRFLEAGGDEPAAFCPNAPTFRELQRSPLREAWWCGPRPPSVDVLRHPRAPGAGGSSPAP
jgi:hypothetical protein